MPPFQYQTRTVSRALWKCIVLLARKCLDGDTCNTFSEFFEFDHHNKSTRNNNVLLKVPKVKLEVAKAGLLFMEVKFYNSLPLEIRKLYLDFRDKENNYFKNK